jgi:DNA phosphorothioation-associated putative methyltransferase
VIENPSERVSILKQAWSLAQKVLIVSARLLAEVKVSHFASFEDGFITRRLTFQKYYDQQELRNWIDSVLGESSVAAGPGIFYVFHDQNVRQSFIASKYKRSIATPRLRRGDLIFEQYKTLFEPLMAFIALRGRLPGESELDATCDILKEIGSLKCAFNIIRSVTGEEQWDEIHEARSQDLLIYLALSRFGGRPRFSQLSEDLQLDVRAFFSTYKRACELADNLLFSAGDPNTISNSCCKSSVGKLTAGSLYVHVSAVPLLSPVLRIYEGCARAYIGAVEGANIVKLNHRWPQVSYLAYPEFERDPHPVLFASLVVPLQTFHIQYREYMQSTNPPILHRKETFLPPNHPMRQKFERLTKQEEKYGLYEDTKTIGTKDGWEEALSKRGLSLSGHRVMRRKSLFTH